MTPRTRTRTTITRPTISSQFHRNGVLISATPVIGLLSGEYETCSDEVGPEYALARKQGGFCVRNLTHCKGKMFTSMGGNSLGNISYKGGITTRDTYTLYPANPDISSSFPGIGIWKGHVPGLTGGGLPISFPGSYEAGTRTNAVLAQAYAKAQSADWLSLVSMAEIEKTVDSVQRLGTMLPRLKAWITRNRKKLFTKSGILRATGNLASQWLEYRYGFMQLYYDYTSMCKVLNRPNGKYAVHVSGWSDGKSEFRDELLSNDRAFEVRKVVDGRRFDTIKAGVVVRVKPLYDITRSLGLSQPLTTAWELVPFSFIIDWFISVSDCLAALEGRFLADIVCSWTSHRIDYNYRLRQYVLTHRTYEPNGVDYTEGFGSSDVSLLDEGVSYVRIANPQYHYSLPLLRLKLNWEKCADTASLLRGVKHNALR